MTIGEKLNKDIESMKAQGKTTEEIMNFVDEVVDEWNREEYARQRFQRMLDGVTA